MAKISIVVPAFNAEKYLSQCVDSIRQQTFKDFELWIIDDGSIDDTGKIAEEYSRIDCRINFKRQENKGVSSARNYGLDCCSGEFVCFVDSDDLLEPTYLQDLYTAIGEDQDSSVCGFSYFGCPEEQIIAVIPAKSTLSLEESIIDFYDLNKKEKQRYLWNRLLRRSLIERFHIRFDEDIFLKEDGLFLIRFLCSSGKNVSGVNKDLYHYRQNAESIMGTVKQKFNKKQLSNIIAHKRILEILRQHQSSEKVLNLAMQSAEISCSWVIGSMKRTHSHNVSARLWIEIQMLATLKVKEYFRWHFGQLLSRIVG